MRAFLRPLHLLLLGTPLTYDLVLPEPEMAQDALDDILLVDEMRIP
jgi:hypothetical protein